MHRRLLIVLLAVALTVAAAAASGARQAATARSAAPALARVTLIGDSIAGAVGQEQAARAVLARGVDLDIEVAVCRRLIGESCPYAGVRPPTLVALLPTLRLGSTVVVAMGYNDSEETFSDSVEAALTALERSGVEHVLWLTLRAERQSYLRMNDVVRAAADRHRSLTVVDWNVYSRSHPDWFQPDGLHLTTRGAIAMATLVHRSLQALALVAPPPAIATRSLPRARVGRPYLARLAVSRGTPPIRWAETTRSLPAGLRLAANGRLAGTPRFAGRRALSLRVTDAFGRSATRRLTLTVAAR